MQQTMARYMCAVPCNLNITAMPMAVQHDLYNILPKENVQNVSTNQDLLVQVPTWQVFANPKNADVAGWRI